MCSTSMVNQVAGFKGECQEQPWKETELRRAEESSGLFSLLDKILSHWQKNNLWGLTQCHVQMGFNECGDDNDDNYSNSFLSLHPREVSAAFCYRTKFERWPSFLSLFCNSFPRMVHCFSSFTSLKSAYAQQCARFSGGYERKMRLLGGTWAIRSLMPGPGVRVCTGNTLKQETSGFWGPDNSLCLFVYILSFQKRI